MAGEIKADFFDLLLSSRNSNTSWKIKLLAVHVILGNAETLAHIV